MGSLFQRTGRNVPRLVLRLVGVMAVVLIASFVEILAQGSGGLTVFVTDDRGEWAETLGAEYLYSFMDDYAVGVFLDHAGGELRSSVLGVAFWARLVKGLGVMFGPGIEYLEEAHAEDGGHGEAGSERQFLARFGAGYSFHVGKRYSLMPVVHADFVDGKVVWVTGLNFGIRFGKNSL